MAGGFCSYCMDEPCSCETPSEFDRFIAMKMLVRFKELRKEQPNKPRPDVGLMLDLLFTARHFQSHNHFENKG